mmetsp:Transcript_60586/g.108069  ORF Transcript_60586/g.108069 Transcript_60586/m.108069 type:complete len:92 (-) Transcript_60586:1062-1337(-)
MNPASRDRKERGSSMAQPSGAKQKTQKIGSKASTCSKLEKKGKMWDSDTRGVLQAGMQARGTQAPTAYAPGAQRGKPWSENFAQGERLALF